MSFFIAKVEVSRAEALVSFAFGCEQEEQIHVNSVYSVILIAAEWYRIARPSIPGVHEHGEIQI